MNVRLLFPNDYIGAPDLQGRDVTVTIARIQIDELRSVDGNGNEKKPVVYFKEMEERHRNGKSPTNKRLVLNKTNAMVIAKLHGHETDDWRGKRITLYPTTCQAFGDTVECIRIRNVAPAPKGKAEPEPDADEGGGWTSCGACGESMLETDAACKGCGVVAETRAKAEPGL